MGGSAVPAPILQADLLAHRQTNRNGKPSQSRPKVFFKTLCCKDLKEVSRRGNRVSDNSALLVQGDIFLFNSGRHLMFSACSVHAGQKVQCLDLSFCHDHDFGVCLRKHTPEKTITSKHFCSTFCVAFHRFEFLNRE